MSQGAQPSWGRAITVASYNIHSCVGLDGRHDPGRIAQVIREMEPDVIGLQEVDSGYQHGEGINQLEDLERAVGYRGVSCPTVNGSRGHFGNALLSRWPVRAVACLDLSVNGREPRKALDALVEVDGQAVRVIVTHLGMGLHERKKQIKGLLALVGSHRVPVQIVMGDFNEWRRWRGGSLEAIDGHLGRSVPIPSWPSLLPLLALDRIWASPQESLVEVKAHRSRLARLASDHLPVLARVRLVKGSDGIDQGAPEEKGGGQAHGVLS